jgi:hypothetical protein
MQGTTIDEVTLTLLMARAHCRVVSPVAQHARTKRRARFGSKEFGHVTDRVLLLYRTHLAPWDFSEGGVDIAGDSRAQRDLAAMTFV